METGVNVYGTDWCEDTTHAREHLDGLGVAYQYINIDRDPASQNWVKLQNDGKQKTPTIQLKDLVLSVPSDAQLDAALRVRGMLAS